MRTITLLCLTAALAACSSTPEPATPRPDASVLSPGAPEWVYNPSYDWAGEEEPFVYFATGRARLHLNTNLAEQSARADAEADVMSFLETTIERLFEAWAAESGDLHVDSSLSSEFNREMFTREVISGTISGVRPMGSWYDDQHFYVWVKFNAEDSFLGPFQKRLAAEMREQTRELTNAERDRMRAELERVVSERNER